MLRLRFVGPVLMAGLIGAVLAGTAFAQMGGPPAGGPGGGGRGGRGGFNPEQFRQMRLDRIKQDLGATDEQWKALQPLVEKVMTAQADARSGGGMGRMFGRGGRGGQGGAPAAPETETQKAAQALQTVLENKDSTADQVDAALKAYRAAREKAQQALSDAQKVLRDHVLPRQEAQLVLDGILE